MSKLTPKQARFVAEYLIDLNATQAAIRAGYSSRTANEQASRLLAKASISEVLGMARNAISERTELTQDEVIAGLRFEATNTGDGSSHSARVAAWTQLGKHLGMFKDKVEHSGTLSIASLIEQSFGKPAGDG
jgi:phage terminase small subunit